MKKNIIVGGPDFTDEQHSLQYELEQFQLGLRLPPYHQQSTGPKRLSFPFLKKGWLEQNCTAYKQHQSLAIDHFYWPYQFDGNQIGVFVLDVELKQIKDNNIDAFDLAALSHYVIREYHDFYNAPDPYEGAPQGYGFNTWRRQSLMDKEPMVIEHENGEETLFDTEYKLRILKYNLFPPLEPAQILSISGRNWVYYESFNSIGPHAETDNLYCIPLNTNTLLQLRFTTILQDLPDAYSAWQADAKDAEIQIMRLVELMESLK